jgi:hypothetical protein
MSRDLTAALADALDAADLRPAILFEGAFPSGMVRIWTGAGPVEWDGKTWTGVGVLLGLGALEETSDVVATGTTVSLSGVPLDLVGLAIDEARQGQPGRIWLALLSEDRQIIADPVQAFSGRLDAQSCRITISYESRLIDLNVPRNWRYTHENQQVLFAGDLGFAHVTAIQDQEITWGRG